MSEKEDVGNELDDIEFDVDDTISLIEFMNLDRKAVAKGRKVDWDAMANRLIRDGRPFSTTTIRRLAQEYAHREGTIHLYHSEIDRVLKSWGRNEEFELMKRVRKSDGRNFYYLKRVA